MQVGFARVIWAEYIAAYSITERPDLQSAPEETIPEFYALKSFVSNSKFCNMHASSFTSHLGAHND